MRTSGWMERKKSKKGEENVCEHAKEDLRCVSVCVRKRENNADSVPAYGSLALFSPLTFLCIPPFFHSHPLFVLSPFTPHDPFLFIPPLKLETDPLLPPPPLHSTLYSLLRHVPHFPSSLPLIRPASIHPFISPCKNLYFFGE